MLNRPGTRSNRLGPDPDPADHLKYRPEPERVPGRVLGSRVLCEDLYYRSPDEQFQSFSTIGEEELYTFVKSAKPTTCMLDPIPSKLQKEVLPEVIDPLLAIINSSLS